MWSETRAHFAGSSRDFLQSAVECIWLYLTYRGVCLHNLFVWPYDWYHLHWIGLRNFLGFSTIIVEFSNLVNRNILWLNSMGSSSTENSGFKLFVVRFFMFQTFVTEKPSSISAVSISLMGIEWCKCRITGYRIFGRSQFGKNVWKNRFVLTR
jgi:hypothetical protein